jgi:hypothetical protein
MKKHRLKDISLCDGMQRISHARHAVAVVHLQGCVRTVQQGRRLRLSVLHSSTVRLHARLC